MNRVIGLNISIDLQKVTKAKIKDGRFINVTSFINLDEVDRFNNNGAIIERQTPEEQGGKKVYIGNTDVFWVQELDSVKMEKNKRNEGTLTDEFVKKEFEIEDDVPF
jgi:hypothetical protein